MRVAHNLVNLTGQRFGKLLVVGRAHNTHEGKAQWHCACDCGKTTVVVARSLRRGATTSCGCNRQRSHRKLPPFQAGMNNVIREYQRGARDRNFIWDLTKEQAQELLVQSCFYCGDPPSRIVELGKYNGDALVNGLDRLDSTKGYTRENIVPCCKRCNWAKSNLTLEEFYTWVRKVNNHIPNA